MQTETNVQVSEQQSVMSDEVKMKLPQMMRKFINDVLRLKPDADVSFSQDADGNTFTFKNLGTQGMWIGYQLGYKQAKRTEPGTFMLAKVTDTGFEISQNPRFSIGWNNVEKARKLCEKKFKGTFVALSISRAAYEFLKNKLKGNPNVIWSNEEIQNIPISFHK